MKTFRIAERIARVQLSAVREILKVTERPDILSFAGGLPAPETFPVEAFAEAYSKVFATQGAQALQYSTTEGFRPLREWIASRLSKSGVSRTADNVLVTSGSQQALDLVSRALLDPGDTVLVENPSYLAALQVFQSYGATMETVPSDEHGMRVDAVERVLTSSRPKFIYAVPTFSNPTGATLSFERRERLALLAKRFSVPVIEDEPYAELRYGTSRLPPVAAFDPGSPVVSLGTFSKTLSPGIRVGWLAAPDALLHTLVVAKQAADLHTASLTQRAVVALLESFDFEAHLDSIRALYRERRDAMVASLTAEFPEGTRWSTPEGGLFIWVELPYGLSSDEVLPEAVREKVAFVPGSPFFAHAPQRQFMRLNFSNREPALIREGMRRLGAVVRAHARSGIDLAASSAN